MIGWQHPLPVWAWLLVVAASGCYAWWTYHRLTGSRRVRGVCCGLRWLVLVLVAVLIAGPEWVTTRDEREPYAVAVLVDRSASMAERDVFGEGGAVSRDESFRAAVSGGGAWSAAGLGGREPVWLGFDGAVFEVGEGAAGSPATGGETALRSAVDAAAARLSDRPVGAVVVVSDGRSEEALPDAWLAAVARREVPVVVVPVGGDAARFDVAVGEAEHPSYAFVNDPVPVRVRVRQLGGEPADPGAVVVRLVDEATGATLDERAWSDAEADGAVQLVGRSAAAGVARWRVEVAAPGDAVAGNDARALALELTDEPLRVLYVEAYPRWEYRYLASLLVREPSVRSSMLLLSAARSGVSGAGGAAEFVQEGDTPIRRFPLTARELAGFDVVVIGDVPPSAFAEEQLALIRDHVAEEGAGLMWVGGPRSTPVAYAGTALDAALPMVTASGVRALPVAPPGLLVRPTGAARALNVLRLDGPENAASDDVPGWPNALSPVLWAQGLGELKPTAEVLAMVHGFDGAPGAPNDVVLGEGLPVLTRMPYGAGVSLYLATDEAWRWRRGRGELYFEQFWLPLVRHLGRTRLETVGRGQGRLTVSGRRVEAGDAVTVTLRLADPDWVDRLLEEAVVRVTRVGDAGGEGASRTLTLRSEPLPDDLNEVASQRFEATWVPGEAGAYRLEVVDALSSLGLSAAVTARPGGRELLDPRPDHAKLRRLAAATGGAVLAVSDAAELGAVLDRLNVPEAVVTPDERRRPLGTGWWPLLAVLGLLTVEWVLRKTARLV